MSLIDEACGICGYDPDYRTTVVLNEQQLAALHDLWVAKDRARGQEPVGFVRDDYKKTMNQYGSTILEPEKSEIRYVPLYTHAQDVAEIQAEALEKIYARYSHGISGLNLQREIAKLRKGD